MSTADFHGWIPAAIEWIDEQPVVEWCYLGDAAFSEPFFEDTIERCLRRPFSRLFRRRTPIDALGAWHAQRPGLPPTGFIFHMSRCGSTLVAQMLAALPRHIVISEAAPIDALLRGGPAHITDADRVLWLRWLVSALGQPRRGGEDRYFIKFDAWHVLQLPLIERAFPGVPWMFVQRELSEVTASHMRERGAHTVPQLIDPAVFGIDRQLALSMPAGEYVTCVLKRILDAAQHALRQRGRALDYGALPEAVCSVVPEHLHFTLTPEERGALMDVANFDAKRPQLPFRQPETTASRSP